jgi:hypothetical protein
VNNANSLTRRGFLSIAALSGGQFGQPNLLASEKSGLIGHWKLTGDAKDYSGRSNHGQNHGVRFSPLGAKFDGRRNYIEVPNKNLLNFGAGDFSISSYVNLDHEVDDLPGDIVSKYDAVARRGFTLSVCNNSGCTPNSRGVWARLRFRQLASSPSRTRSATTAASASSRVGSP